MIKIALAFSLLLIHSTSFAGPSACPEQLSGKWFCHDQGSLGDGADETTYFQSYTPQFEDSVLTAFDAVYDYDGPVSYRIALDGTPTTTVHVADNHDPQFRRTTVSYGCSANRLVKTESNRHYLNFAAFRDDSPESTFTTETTISMTGDDSYEAVVSRAPDGLPGGTTEVCVRKARGARGARAGR